MQYPSYFTEELVEEIANNPKGEHLMRLRIRSDASTCSCTVQA
jgi:hypothetical protein